MRASLFLLSATTVAICPPTSLTPPSNCAQDSTWTLVTVSSAAFCTLVAPSVCSSALNTTGNCPGPQEGLEFGSYCDLLPDKNVYGCLPRTTCEIVNTITTSSAPPCLINTTIPPESYCCAATTSDGWTSISVETRDSYCTKANADGYCVANIATGACPEPQNGLPYGSECKKVLTGVYGCVPRATCPPKNVPKLPPCVSLPPIKQVP
ncbi:hypothetical protein THRCLA_20173 [Thraustotheca clavata]|uniref:Secreted protein n=1 Tax=Thraustotheca clavata TaxID=74557 RepID=A0A1W0AAJ6_9STRA|nr:hypothetical protein THRCLA_20173 [Thraustotheca clavata]